MKVAPLLAVRDLATSLGFWRDALGGQVVVEWETYARLTLGEGELHLATTAPPTVDRPGVALVPPSDLTSATSEVVLNVTDVDGLAASLMSSGWPMLAPPHEPAWGGERRCFLRDPDGHLVEVTQRL